MADRGPRRAGPVWVWLLGLIVLVVVIWLLVRWVAERDEGATAAGAPAAAEEAGDVVVQAEGRDSAIEDVESASVAVPLESVLPLGPADTGVLTTFAGEVVGDEVEQGAWLRTGSGEAIFVQVADADEPRFETGDRVEGRGVIRHHPARVRIWVREAELGTAQRLRLVSDYYVETTPDRLGAP